MLRSCQRVRERVVKIASVISEFTERIGLDNTMRSWSNLEAADSHLLNNLPTVRPLLRILRPLRILLRILLEVAGNLAVGYCWGAGSTILVDAMEECSTRQR